MARVGDATYEWTLLWRDSQRDEDGRFYGHSFYRDGVTDRVSVKDMSGDLPHETDDGPLWVDGQRPVRFCLNRYGSGAGYAELPVIAERERCGRANRSVVGMTWRDAVKACRNLGLKVEVQPAIGELLKLIAEVVTLPKGGE